MFTTLETKEWYKNLMIKNFRKTFMLLMSKQIAVFERDNLNLNSLFRLPFEQRAKSVHNSDQNSNNGQKVGFSDHHLSNNYLNTGIVLDNGYLNTKIMLGCV